MQYADLILPLPLPGVFTYSVPLELQSVVFPGKIVIVQFGRKKSCPAVVKNIHNIKPEGYSVKDISSVPPGFPVILPVQIRFWEWLASYYMCPEGEVLKAALPGGLRPAGADSGVIKPKTESYLSLHPSVCSKDMISQLHAGLKRAPAQLKILTSYLQISGYTGAAKESPAIPKSLLAGTVPNSRGAVKALVDKSIFTETIRTVSRLRGTNAGLKEISRLNRFQEEALADIKEQFKTKEVVLLNGITSGGKTEIYIHLIKEQLEKGKQVLYLLPEIALTTQIIVRLKSIFSDIAGVYHSRFSDAERVEIWNKVLNKDDEGYKLILGARSSLFLPFSDLGLVIVDEEHENTFKQFDPAPRYNARDSATMLASMHGAKTLLGTATPSVESYFNAISGKYGLVNLLKRFEEMELPRVIIADTREARKKKTMKSLFTPQLLDAIQEVLDKGEQIILFQNRRGYAPFIECAECGWIPLCQNCDVSMTYHKSLNQLLCHYCGASFKPAALCPECGSHDIKTKGFGTEKIEDEVSLFFPSARVGRLDIDAARKKRAHEKIIGEFESGNLDILAGTQMIAKGLDFGKVSLVGILNADNLLFFPDFRAHERSFQLISQVSGRAGRKLKGGRVVIQTGFPGHPVIKNIIAGNFKKHFSEQLAERREFLYPPFVRLIRITIKDARKETVEKASATLAARLKKRFGSRVLGPEYPLVGRIQKRYVMNIMLKIEKGANLSAARTLITAEIERLHSLPGFRYCQVYPDVDPF